MICIHCHHAVTDHAVDDEERRECLSPGCSCRQYECRKPVGPLRVGYVAVAAEPIGESDGGLY